MKLGVCCDPLHLSLTPIGPRVRLILHAHLPHLVSLLCSYICGSSCHDLSSGPLQTASKLFPRLLDTLQAFSPSLILESANLILSLPA